MNTRMLLSGTATKEQQTMLFKHALLKRFKGNKKRKTCVAGAIASSNQLRLLRDDTREHDHEEADLREALIPLHCLDAANCNPIVA